jgi:hypothetical protein
VNTVAFRRGGSWFQFHPPQIAKTSKVNRAANTGAAFHLMKKISALVMLKLTAVATDKIPAANSG